MLGMGSAFENICGQVFGAGQVDMLVFTCKEHAWIILWMITRVLLLLVCIFATPILKLPGQEDTIADLAGENPLFW
jgi:MATE family multidrug resistance protein